MVETDNKRRSGIKLLLRGVFGLLWAGVFVAAAWWGAWWPWLGLLIVLAVLSVNEYAGLLPAPWRPYRGAAVVGAVLIIGGAWARDLGGLALGALGALIVTTPAVLLVKPSAGGRPLGTSLAALHVGLGLGAAFLLGRGASGGQRLLLFLAALWTADTAAFIFGKLLGRRKLTPELSPKKTVAGLVFGLIFAAAAAWALDRWLLDTALGDGVAVGFGLVVAAFALVGDLLISALKRRAGLDDTGRLIPGHGGVLDRLDSFLVAAPAALVYLAAVEQVVIFLYRVGFD